jgi:AcrR family transcriptional regulator
VSPRPAPDLPARRDRVLGHARRIAEAEGWGAVTIRRLATELGVTQPVLYTAFGKRQDIVDAVALRGFAELAAALDTGDPAAAYLDFARTHRATYEAMFLMPTGLRFAAGDGPAPMRVAFTALGRALGITAVDDIEDVIARLRTRGAELVGELAHYEDIYRLCYVRGPEGIIVGLAEQLS